MVHKSFKIWDRVTFGDKCEVLIMVNILCLEVIAMKIIASIALLGA